MNYKKVLSVLIIILVFVAGGVAVYFYRNSLENKKADEKIENKSGVVIEDKKITDGTKPFSIDITYPAVAGLDDFNKKVEDIVNNELFEFKKNSVANDVAVKEVDPVDYAKYPREYSLTIDYDKGLVDENTISVVFNIYSFEGGAHGASTSVALNYDVKNKKEIKLADLFLGQADYLQKISDFCIADLAKQIDPQMLDNSWLKTGAGPVAENYPVFLINKDNLMFYFQQYQVAAGAVGDFKVTYPR